MRRKRTDADLSFRALVLCDGPVDGVVGAGAGDSDDGQSYCCGEKMSYCNGCCDDFEDTQTKYDDDLLMKNR